jgi:hypothetical protein
VGGSVSLTLSAEARKASLEYARKALEQACSSDARLGQDELQDEREGARQKREAARCASTVLPMN